MDDGINLKITLKEGLQFCKGGSLRWFRLQHKGDKGEEFLVVAIAHLRKKK